MAAFVDSSTYLKYGRRPPGKHDKVQAVLWPVMVHRVLYPEVKQPTMNLFQKAVLRLIRAKNHDAEDIAQLTGLHTNLIKLIQAQLVSRGWINDQATELTDNGIKAITEEDNQSEQLASGYLFQDAVTGKLWPRIDNKLKVMEASNPQSKYPEFVQDRKTGYTLKPFKPAPPKSDCSQPDTKGALNAWQDYRADYRAAKQLHSGSGIPKQIKLSGIRFQTEQPESAWILVWVTPSHDSNLWSIKDPFDIRDEAWWLKDTLPQLLENNNHLLKQLAKLIGQAEPDTQTVAEWLQSLKEQSQLHVLVNYPWAQKEPDIAAAIAVLLTRKETLEQGQDHKNDLETAVTESQKLLEVLMQWLIKTFPANTGSLPKQSKNNHELNKKLLTALALPAFTDQVIEPLSRQSLKVAISTLRTPSSSLKGLVFAAALGSLGHDNHPFKQLTNQRLQLRKLLDLADLRNQTSHGNSRYTGKQYTEITLEIAQQHIDYALQFTEHFKEWING
ncbi:hypothetical protein ACFQ45_17020 [Rhodanobacter aciditrophus]|uniref:PRTase associated wHTH domain-containing protein n=1 Tax=Rhodanobacter aciditrophus TaxID=1623218 RepID=A0ABW4B4C9_9GAMM